VNQLELTKKIVNDLIKMAEQREKYLEKWAQEHKEEDKRLLSSREKLHEKLKDLLDKEKTDE